MAIASIKKEFLTRRIAFNNSGARLRDRQDIDLLAIIALESKDKSLLRLFETIPDLATLKKAKTESELKALKLRQT